MNAVTITTETPPFTTRLFEALPGNHVLLKADAPAFTVVAVTQGYEEIASKAKEALVGSGLFQSFPSNPDDPANTGEHDIRASFIQVLSHKKPHTLPVQRYDTLNAEGLFTERYWKTVTTPLLDAAGNVDYLLHSVEEITDKMLAEKLAKAHETLTVTNQYLQQIINLVKAPLQVLEPVFEAGRIADFRYKLVNAAYSAYANTTPEALHDKRVGDVFPGYFQTSSFTNVAKTFETGVADEWEIHYNADGLDIYNQMNATRMDGEVVVHFTEITHLKNLQLQLERKVAELERSNGSLEEFAHAASHDLKEPVRKILVFTGRLKEQLSPQLAEAERKTFEKIEGAAGRMGLLIDDLLLYSHVSQQPAQKEPVDLAQTVQQVVEELELDIQQKGAAVQAGHLPVVAGFKRQLQQAFQNLIGNALKYGKAGTPPVVSVTAETGGRGGRPYHVIRVQDNGIGFDQQHAEKIFGLFTRLHGKGEYGGTGIGLSIVKKVVENHRGFIEAESTPGEGSAFTVYLPAE